MVMDNIVAIFEELVTDPIKNHVVTPIRRLVSYAFKRDSNAQRLQQQVHQLQIKKDRLEQSIDDARRSGEEIFPNVTQWLTTAQTHIEEADMIIQAKQEAMKCFFGFCPNVKTRYRLSKISEKRALAIDELCNEQGLDLISFQPPLQQIVELSLYSREALPSRVLMLNQVMGALKDPDLNTIGVYGMGGVGKTTLAKEVQMRALQEKLFETVVLVAVSQTPEIRRIQAEIGDFLGLRFFSDEIPGRASQLYSRLKNSNVLIILDDLWQRLHLDAIGIPSRDASRGCCKIMLTSRNRDVLSGEMGAQKLFPLELLKEEEALTLFEMSVAEVKDPKFHATAVQIAKKCHGLPLLIQIVAAKLAYKELYEWNNTLNQLSTFGDEEMNEKVFRALECSFENLPGYEIQSFFLLCALFGEPSIRIQHLLAYSMGLGLFKHCHTVEAAWDYVFSLINKLKDRSLLMDEDMVGFVKMHGVVRLVAISIASRRQHAFIGSGEVRFRDWLHKDCTRISLPYCNVSELPVGLDYPMAEMFLLFTEDSTLKVSDLFFERMQKLKVVDFRGVHLVSIPSSFGLLANLQTLCLELCQLDDVATLGELNQLEFLSFAKSNIVALPRDIEHLTRLKLLDLRSCSNLLVIPANVLSRLRSLEELYMLNSFVGWDVQGNVSLTELESLARLSTLEIQIPDLKLIPVGFKCFSRLRSYKISIGNIWDWNERYERSRTLKLEGDVGVYLEGGTELLLQDAEDLYLDGMRGIQRIIYEGFPRLKHIQLKNDSDIRHIVNPTLPAADSYNACPVLESLYLSNLKRLENVCGLQVGLGSFRELRILKINDCHKLGSLFSFSSFKCLSALQGLEIESCENMEGVVCKGTKEMHHRNEVIELTHLSSLKLKNLPRLIGFCKIGEEVEQMGMLFSATVSFPNLASLEVNGCQSLKHIAMVSTAKCLMQLKNLMIRDCELDEEIILSQDTEEIQEEDSTDTIMFHELESLSLLNLKNVKSFSRRNYLEFPLLSELTIEGYRSMRNIVGNSSCNEIEEEEHRFNEMVTFSNLERTVCESSRDGRLLDEIRPHQNIRRITINYYMEENWPSWMKSPSSSDSFLELHNLVDLKLEWCYHCIQLPCLGNLPHLKTLEMKHMRKVKRIDYGFYGVESEESSNGFLRLFPALESLSLTWMENLTEWSSPSDGEKVIAFPSLKFLSICYCPKLTSFPTSDLSKLVKLEMKHCEELIPIFGQKPFIASLSSLSIMGCPKLTDLQIPPPSVRSFKELSVCQCEWLISVPYNLQKVSNLTSLEIYCCRRLRYFPEDILSELSKLRRLSIGAFSEELDGFQYLNRIKELQCVEELEIWGSDFFGREMCSLPNQLQHLRALKSLKVMGFTAMEALPQWLTNMQSLCSLSLDYCRNLGCQPTATIIKRLQNLSRLSISSCHIPKGSECEWLLPSRSRIIDVELPQVSKNQMAPKGQSDKNMVARTTKKQKTEEVKLENQHAEVEQHSQLKIQAITPTDDGIERLPLGGYAPFSEPLEYAQSSCQESQVNSLHGILDAVNNLMDKMEKGFENMGKRFDQVEEEQAKLKLRVVDLELILHENNMTRKEDNVQGLSSRNHESDDEANNDENSVHGSKDDKPKKNSKDDESLSSDYHDDYGYEDANDDKDYCANSENGGAKESNEADNVEQTMRLDMNDGIKEEDKVVPKTNEPDIHTLAHSRRQDGGNIGTIEVTQNSCI